VNDGVAGGGWPPLFFPDMIEEDVEENIESEWRWNE
jgi:hypothetical protein